MYQGFPCLGVAALHIVFVHSLDTDMKLHVPEMLQPACLGVASHRFLKQEISRNNHCPEIGEACIRLALLQCDICNS